jgi:hypothetical protein
MTTYLYLILLAYGDKTRLCFVAHITLEKGSVSLDVRDTEQEAWLRAFFSVPHMQPIAQLLRPEFVLQVINPIGAKNKTTDGSPLSLYVFARKGRGWGLPFPSARIYPLHNAIQVYLDTDETFDYEDIQGKETKARKLIHPWDPRILSLFIQEISAKGPGWIVLAAPQAACGALFFSLSSPVPAADDGCVTSDALPPRHNKNTKELAPNGTTFHPRKTIPFDRHALLRRSLRRLLRALVTRSGNLGNRNRSDDQQDVQSLQHVQRAACRPRL